MVDFEVMSNMCVACERMKAKEDNLPLKDVQNFITTHDAKCAETHKGYSNAMEVAAAKIIWERSKSSELHYVTVRSDWDSKPYDAVAKLKP